MPDSPSVLIVEDSPFVLASLVSLAREYVPAQSIATARSGIEVLDVLGRTWPELVVLDVGRLADLLRNIGGSALAAALVI